MTSKRGGGVGAGPFRTAGAFVVGVLLGVSLILSAVSTDLGAVLPGGSGQPVWIVLTVGLLLLFIVTLGFATLYQLFAVVDQ